MKRACDSCIKRKLRCDGGHPCTRCQQAGVQECRFLKPVLKRGPKGSAAAKSNSATLNGYIALFEESLYAVWPIVDAACLSRRLDHADQDIEAYVLASALSAATASQLQLPVFGSNSKIDAAYLASQTVKGRSLYDYREEPSLDAIRTSFFLHVYHATLLKYHSSMIFLQEAIAFAKLLWVRFQEQQDGRREELDTLLTLLVSPPGHDDLSIDYPIHES
ncbi:MAG: hypothetical protein M1818_002478 [Claussenomyces sp. TS43310]|nr:MAG: hypothetical protein M1818_002478 [Claussenomyces sp. TS43310]